jgi:hypothetical protein
MAFCNKCGATLSADAKFCNKCGATITGAPAAAPPSGTPSATPAAPTGGGNALKIVLIVFAVIVVLGILGIGTLAIIGIHIARHAHVQQNGNHVKVETPFGNVETSKDPEQAAQELGVEIYPGAQIESNGAQSASFGGMRTVAANFETSDPVEKVCSFYKSKFPNATVSTSNQNQCAIVSKDSKNMVSINVEASGDTTKFHIATVSK